MTSWFPCISMAPIILSRGNVLDTVIDLSKIVEPSVGEDLALAQVRRPGPFTAHITIDRLLYYFLILR